MDDSTILVGMTDDKDDNNDGITVSFVKDVIVVGVGVLSLSSIPSMRVVVGFGGKDGGAMDGGIGIIIVVVVVVRLTLVGFKVVRIIGLR